MFNRIQIFIGSLLILAIGSPLLAQIKPAEGLAEDDIIDTVVMVDMPADEVLKFLEFVTGRIILRPQTLPNMTFNFDSQGPLTREEAIRAVESVLSMNSLSIIPLDEKFLRAVPINIPVNALTPEFVDENMPESLNSQKVYAKIFEIQYLRMETAIEIISRFLTPSLPPPVEFQQSNKLLLTDSLNNLKRVEEILKNADSPAQQREEIFFIQLKNTQSRELKQRLDNLIQRSLQSFLVGDTTIEADERTNQMILITHPANQPTLTTLIEKMDINVSPLTTTQVFRVNHAKAEELSPLLESVINNQRQARERAERESQNNQSNRNQQQANNQQGQGPQNQGAAQPNTGNESSESGGKNVQFSEYVGVVPDPRTNAIIAYGTPSDISQLETLLKSLDVLLPQVLIEVIITEVTLSENHTRGIDALGLNLDVANGVWALSGISISADDSGVDIANGNIADASAAGVFRDFDLDLAIRAAAGNGTLRVLNAPQILTTHARPATITVGQQRPVITSSQTDSTGTSTRSQVTYRNIGLELTVTPLIGSDGQIQLEITQTIDNLAGQISIDGNEQPIIGNRVAESFVSVEDSDVIILGGLQEYNTRTTESRMGILGYLPVIGDSIFTRKFEEDERRELMIFVRPRILPDTESATNYTEENISKTPRIESEVRPFIESGLYPSVEIEESEESNFFNPRARNKN
ncbi:MAG: secretin N-terminal domain-containing protein [Verrucomicrobiota bacterium]